jgi:hypothetical protein
MYEDAKRRAEARMDNRDLCVCPSQQHLCTTHYDSWPTELKHIRNLWDLRHREIVSGAGSLDDKNLVLWDKPLPENFYEPIWVSIADAHASVVEYTGYLRTASMLISAAGDADQCMLIWLMAALTHMEKSLDTRWPTWVEGRAEFGALLRDECHFTYAHAVKNTLPIVLYPPPCPSFSHLMTMAVTSRLLIHGFYRIAPSREGLEKRKYYWESYRTTQQGENV